MKRYKRIYEGVAIKEGALPIDSQYIQSMGNCAQELLSIKTKLTNKLGNNTKLEGDNDPMAKSKSLLSGINNIINKVNYSYSSAGKEQDSPFYNK